MKEMLVAGHGRFGCHTKRTILRLPLTISACCVHDGHCKPHHSLQSAPTRPHCKVLLPGLTCLHCSCSHALTPADRSCRTTCSELVTRLCQCRGSIRLPNGTLSPAAFSPIPRSAAAAALQIPVGSALLLPSKEPQLHFELLWEQDIAPGRSLHPDYMDEGNLPSFVAHSEALSTQCQSAY